MDIERLNIQNEALITLLDNTVENISQTKDELKGYEFTRLENSIFYIIEQLGKNTKAINKLIEKELSKKKTLNEVEK